MVEPENTCTVRLAGGADTGAIAALINAAFLVEKFFIDGDRINEEEVRRLLEKGCFLAAEAEGGLAGCVYVECTGDRAYLGLLSVAQSRRRGGVGRRLVAAAEEIGRQSGCKFIDLRIVNLRTELPAYYQRLGYEETGAAPFPADVPTKVPCHFIIMSKGLG
jgi:N-acetylglutamate synthase-like GNAT family acetyltransferase